MARIWADELATYAKPDLDEALRRYIRSGAREDLPPSLQTLRDLAYTVRGERRKREVGERMPVGGIDEVMQNAALNTKGRDAAWARGHVKMHLLGANKPGREAEAIAYCQKMAEEYPDDAKDWLKEADMYRFGSVSDSDGMVDF